MGSHLFSQSTLETMAENHVEKTSRKKRHAQGGGVGFSVAVLVLWTVQQFGVDIAADDYALLVSALTTIVSTGCGALGWHWYKNDEQKK